MTAVEPVVAERGGAVLEAIGLTRSYRPPTSRGRDGPVVHAVVDAALALDVGELVSLAGPSGSGKTTLLNLLVGFEAPDAGSVRRPGTSVPPDWVDVAVVPQSLGLLDELTVAENVALPLRLQRGARPDDVAVEKLLARLGLDHLARRRPREVSLGEQQRTAVARALVARPKVLVLDEPTAHQDAASRDRLVEAFSRAAFEGAAVLVASHDPTVTAVADRHLVMADGRLGPGEPGEREASPTIDEWTDRPWRP